MKFFLVLSLFLSGCATLGFSSKYYIPPVNYKEEVTAIFNETIIKLNTPPRRKDEYLKNTYTIRIGSDNPKRGASISPNSTIANNAKFTIEIQDYLIKYIHEFYYAYRKSLLTCIFIHEIAHAESSLPDNPPNTHFLVDKYALDNLSFGLSISLNNFYNMLSVANNYGGALPGLAGNTFNTLLNLSSLVSMAYGGPYVFIPYGSDAMTRMTLMRKTHQPNTPWQLYKRSK